jgi:hypothetical protein
MGMRLYSINSDKCLVPGDIKQAHLSGEAAQLHNAGTQKIKRLTPCFGR